METRIRRWTWGDSIEPLRETVARGGVLALPTESSYALAADPRSRRGVEAVFRIKQRPAGQPLPVVIAGIDALPDLGVELPAGGLRGLERAWPGPLSVLLPCSLKLPASAGTGHLALRIPGHERLRVLLADLGTGLTATSANRSGEPALLEPGEVTRLLGDEDAILVDDGRLPGGDPSTLIALRPDRAIILRQGRLSLSELESLAPSWFSAEPVEIPVEESR